MCPAGFYCDNVATVAPIMCYMDAYCPEGSILPTACPMGTTNHMSGSAEMSDCLEIIDPTIVDATQDTTFTVDELIEEAMEECDSPEFDVTPEDSSEQDIVVTADPIIEEADPTTWEVDEAAEVADPTAEVVGLTEQPTDEEALIVTETPEE